MNTVKEQPLFIVTDELRQRFYSKAIESPSGCLLWQAAIQRNGYGAFRIGERKIDAHVVAWRIENSGVAVPVGKMVIHTCDVRSCVNLQHLIVGTTSDNMRHALRDGRGSDFIVRGEQSHRAVLSESDVREIRRLYVP